MVQHMLYHLFQRPESFWCLPVQVVVVVSLFGTNVAQIVASASDAYYLEEGNSLDKR
jgi:hypothetical protein